MKPELIADWRARIADRTLITLPVSAIERLLEERGRLLRALKDAGEAFERACGYPQLPMWIDAIAYAESE